MAAKEFSCVCDEVEAMVVLEAIGSAVTTGGITGSIGRTNIASLSATALSECISKWETSFRKASVVTRGMQLAKTLRDVRLAVTKRDWATVTALLDFDGDAVLTAGTLI